MNLKNQIGNMATALLAMAALSSPGAVAANYYSQNCCQPTYQSSCCQVQCDPAPVCGVAYNPPAYSSCSGCDSCTGGWVVSGDFLWWKASAGGIALGAEQTFLQTIDSSSPGFNVIELSDTVSVIKPKFDFDAGFRIGVANNCLCDCWDMALAWTHFRTKASASGVSQVFEDNKNTVLVEAFVPYWEHFPVNPIGGISVPMTSTSHYTLQIDLLDLEFGRKYFVSSCFALRPYIGLRAARIDQTYKVFSATNEAGNDGFFSANYTSHVNAKSDYIAIGPRAGLDIDLHLGCGLSIVGKAAGSIVYGRFDRHSCELYDTILAEDVYTVDSATLKYNSKGSNVNSSRAITDLAIGLKWEHCFEMCNSSYPLELAVLWEQHGFFNMVNFDFEPSTLVTQRGGEFGGLSSTFISPTKKVGDIFTQGLTVSASIGF